MSEKNSLLIKLAAASQPLEVLEEKHRKISRIRKKIRGEMYAKAKGENAVKAIFFPIAIILVIIPILLLLSLLTNDPLITGVDELVGSSFTFFLTILSFKVPLLSIASLVVGVFFYGLSFKTMNAAIKRSTLVSKSENLAIFNDKWSDIAKLRQEIESLLVDSWYTTNLGFLHENYHDIQYIEQMYMVVDEGRATTLSEAINCMLEQRHRDKMEESDSDNLSEAQRVAISESAETYYAATAIMYDDSQFYNK